MPTFLNDLASALYREYKNEIHNLKLVFPTRRAALFFKKELMLVADSAIWSPEIVAIQDFIETLSDKVIPDQLSLLFTLYKVYKKYFPEESFEGFYAWGEVLIRDFEDVDRYMADASKVFTLVRDQRQLESDFDLPEEEQEKLRSFWNHFFEKDRTKLKSEFLKSWECLADIYSDFRNALNNKDQAYEGMLHREVAEKLMHDPDPRIFNGSKVVFAGFYALTPVEESIIRAFQIHGNALLFRDADRFYLDEKDREAGAFFRKGLLSEVGIPWVKEHFKDIPKKVEVSGVPLLIGQARFAGEVLRSWQKEENFNPERTAIVLPDEQLLFPVLYSLPESLQDINVTMGYPLRYAPVHTLSELLFSLQKNCRISKSDLKSWYFKDVLGVLNHPYILRINQEAIKSFLREYSKNRTLRITQKDLEGKLPAELLKVFQHCEGMRDRFEWLRLILLDILDNFHHANVQSKLELEFVTQYYIQVQQLEEILNEEGAELSLESQWQLIRECIQSVKIPFSGEPLRGIQVMGFLETRVLDFDRIILLSLNEDILPASGNRPSFIPYNIRKAFSLPTYEDQHAVSAYHFYRLLQRATDIHLIHNTESRALSGGEPSRFLLQLEHELFHQYSETISIKKNIVTTAVRHVSPETIIVRKTGEVLKILEAYTGKQDTNGKNVFSRRFSASALNSYISCKLKFYFRYIAGLDEEEETEENIEAATFGKILHRAMELLYSNENRIDKSRDKYLSDKLEGCLDEAIRLEYSGTDEVEGKNLLLKHIIRELIQRILKMDMAGAPFEIKSLEKEENFDLLIDSGRMVGFKGIIDRIDESDLGIRILDYKTGRVDKRKPETIDQLFLNPDYKEQFQAFLYMMMIRDKFPGKDLRLGLVAVRELSKGPWYLNDEKPVSDEQLKEYRDHLKAMIQELYNPDLSFDQTEDTDRCLYCPYAGICQRN